MNSRLPTSPRWIPRSYLVFIFATLAFIFATLAAACSGGGGGSASGGEGVGTRRTTGTGIRIVHGALDESPVSVIVGGEILQTARYGEATGYVKLPEGATGITLSRQNNPADLVTQFSANINKGVEYSLFLSGERRTETFNVLLIPDQVLRPASGEAFIRLYNGYDSTQAMTLRVSGASVGSAAKSNVSEFVPIVPGPATLELVRSDGALLGSLPITVADRGEVTVVASGSEELGFFLPTLFPDLD